MRKKLLSQLVVCIFNVIIIIIIKLIKTSYLIKFSFIKVSWTSPNFNFFFVIINCQSKFWCLKEWQTKRRDFRVLTNKDKIGPLPPYSFFRIKTTFPVKFTIFIHLLTCFIIIYVSYYRFAIIWFGQLFGEICFFVIHFQNKNLILIPSNYQYFICFFIKLLTNFFYFIFVSLVPFIRHSW